MTAGVGVAGSGLLAAHARTCPPACPHPPTPGPSCRQNSIDAPLCGNWHKPQVPVLSGCLPRLAWSLPLPGKVMTRAVFVAGSHVGPTGRPARSCPLPPALRQATNGGQSRHGQPYSLFWDGSGQSFSLTWLGQSPSTKGVRVGSHVVAGWGGWLWHLAAGWRRGGLWISWGAFHPLPCRGRLVLTFLAPGTERGLRYSSYSRGPPLSSNFV